MYFCHKIFDWLADKKILDCVIYPELSHGKFEIGIDCFRMDASGSKN
jgi:hypothetical protein